MTIDGVDSEDEKASAAIYTNALLAIYDVYVLQLSNRLAWRCPRRRLLEHYDANVSGHHLDIGPGTGWYLRNATFPTSRPSVHLMDLNATPMEVTSRRLLERGITATSQVGSILRPIAHAAAPFDSVAA